MSAFKGTPGPWAVCSGINAADRPGIEAIGCTLSIVVYGTDDDEEGVFGRTDQEAEANARLIAAAPDSHEANVKFIEAIECLYNVTAGWTDDRIYDELPSSGLALAYFAARAAIAKATGGDA